MSAMTVIRIAKRRRYTTICNETIEDARLSYRALGVLLWLLSKPDDWKVNADHIHGHGREGRDAVLTALKELETHGYLRREKVQMPGGTWVTRSFLYESPNPDFQGSVDDENADFQGSVNQGSVFQGPITKDLEVKTKTKIHQCDERFTKFWNAYRAERRGGSPSALKAWNKIAEDERDLVLLGLTLYNQFWEHKQTEDQWVPLAATFLNDRRWENPPKVPAAAVNGGRRWDERRKIWLEPGVG